MPGITQEQKIAILATGAAFKSRRAVLEAQIAQLRIEELEAQLKHLTPEQRQAAPTK